jgi:hypothetical protein
MDNNLEPINITLHVVGWNKKGVIGFVHGSQMLSYLIPDEDTFEKVKKTYPKIPDKTVQEVNRTRNLHTSL